MYNKIVIYSHNEILFTAIKRNKTADPCSNPGEFQKHYAPAKKARNQTVKTV